MKCPHCKHLISENIKNTKFNNFNKPFIKFFPNNYWLFIVASLYIIYFNIFIVPFMLFILIIILKPNNNFQSKYYKKVIEWKNTYVCLKCHKFFNIK